MDRQRWAGLAAQAMQADRDQEAALQAASAMSRGPYANFDPAKDPFLQRHPPREIDPTTPEDLKNFGKGIVSAVAGVPGDIGNIVLRDAPRAVASPFIELFGGQQPEPLPPYSERFGTSDYIATKLGADMESGATQAGLFGIPGVEDVGKKLAIGALAVADRGNGVLRRFTPSESLDDAGKAIETRFAQQLDADIDGAIEAYSAIPSTRGGKIISVDDARELDPDYAADRSLSAAVHEPASAFSKELWARKMAEPGDGAVMLMSGGTGAGKTTGLQHLPDVSEFHTVFDSNLQSLNKAVAKIDEALGSGRNVEIVHVWRDPIEAFSGEGGSALSRAMKNGGTGRTVPLEAHVATHAGSNRTVKELAERYADDDRVSITIIDNSHGKGASRPADVSVIEDIDEQVLMDAISQELENARQEGRITETVYRGFKGGQ